MFRNNPFKVAMRIALMFVFITAVFTPGSIALSSQSTNAEAAGAADLIAPLSQPEQVAATPVPDQPETESPYFISKTLVLGDGTSLKETIINGPPKPPQGYELERQAVSLPEPNIAMGTNTLSVPAFDWYFGCSATSGAMIAGYYDRNGYPNMYTGSTNGGTMPLENTVWGRFYDGYEQEGYGQCPLTASRNGLDGRTTRGSIDDYWIQYGSSTQDPYITGGWTQHSFGDAIGDFMKTSQSAYQNTDGSTTFYTYNSAAQLPCSDMVSIGAATDGSLGRKLFYEAKGYTVTTCYNQQTDNIITGGFSFAQYKAEIDAGRPVMLNLEGHTIVGVGYNDTGNTVYIHDTWDHVSHSFPWGGSYQTMQLLSVSIVNLAPTATCNTPSTPSLTSPASGLTISDSTPTFDWSDSTYANLYDFILDNNSDFSSPIVSSTSVGSSTYTHTSALANGTYYWKVRGHNTSSGCNVYGSWTAASSFTVSVGNPPGAFYKSYPSNGTSGLSTSQTLSWGASSSVEYYEYCYYTAEEGSCSSWLNNGTATSKAISGLFHSKTYYWQARAVNSAGTTYADTGTWWTFGTEAGEDIFNVYLPIAIRSDPFTGRVTYQGAPAAGQTVNMYYTTDSWDTSSLYATTQTNASGDYWFHYPPKAGSGVEYYVYWRNPGSNTSYLSGWYCEDVEGLSTDKKTCSFDIQDVALSSPAHNVSVSLPYTFRWVARTTTSDIYEVDWWDPDLDQYMWTWPRLSYTNSFTLRSIPASWLTGFPYNWTVYVYGANGNGVPYYYRWVSFSDRNSPPLEGVGLTSELLSENAASGRLPLHFRPGTNMLQPQPAAEGVKPH